MGRFFRLDVDGKPSELSVAVATRWWSRARGLWPGSRWPDYDILKLPRCRAVHTFGMRVPLDVVFSDASGRITSIRHALPPWRVASDRSACSTWEMRAGAARELELRSGTRLGAVDRMRGATAVEFLLAALLVVMPLTFLVLEMAQLAAARHLLRHAVGDAARQASVAELSDSALRRSLAYGLLPLFVPLDARAALDGGADVPSEDRLSMERGLAGLTRAYAESFRPDLAQVRLEPLDTRGRVWRLRVRYCRELYLPLVRRSIPALLRLGTTSLFDQACFARERMPIESWSLIMRRDTRIRAADDLPAAPPSPDDGLPSLPAPPMPGGGGGGGSGGGGGVERSDGELAAN